MSSRAVWFSFSCLFVIGVSMCVLAQSSHAPGANRIHRLGQDPRWGASVNNSQTPHTIPSTARKNVQSSGLNFAPAVDYSSGGNATAVAVADVNGDGKPDLIVTNSCNLCPGTVGVLLGNGDGTFQPVVTYSSGGDGAISVAVADVNGDGKPDVLVADGQSDVVGVLLGNGDGTFQPVVTYSSGGYGPHSVAVADVNGDGKPDVLVTNCGPVFQSCGTLIAVVSVLLGNGDGTFQTAVAYGSGGYDGTSVAVADVNGDGKPDLVVGNQCSDNPCRSGYGLVGVLVGNGDGTFQPVVTYYAGGYLTGLTVGDVNQDGKADVIVAYLQEADGQNNLGVLLGNGDGTFQTPVTYGSGGDDPDSVAVGDVNGDGKPDVVVANECGDSTCEADGSVGVLLGNGDGTFQSGVAYDSGGSDDFFEAYSVVAVADLNQDGKPDVLFANYCVSPNNCTSGTIGVLINTSLTATVTALTSSQNPSSFGQTVTFAATVTAQPGFYKGTPTGTVTFFDGTTNIGNSTMNNNGVATLMDSTLTVGTHTITATYNGDANFADSISLAVNQVVQGAIVVLSPTSLSFANQTVGTTSTLQSVTLMNTGNIALSLSIGITGINGTDFAQTNTCGASVSPGGSCNVNVTFTPSVTGTRSATLNVTDNAPESPQTVSLSGTGISSVVTLSPPSLSFNPQPVGTTSQALFVILSTNGTLNITSITTTAQFAQTNNCGSGLKAGGSCTINVTFTPSAPLVQSGTLTISDDGQGSPQIVSLSGTGTQPAVNLAPVSLKFGNQTVGITSSPLESVLTNTGNGTLMLSSINIAGTNRANFVQTNNCGTSLLAGGSCNITVTFTPSATGTRSAAISFKDNAPGSPQLLPLSGFGVLPVVTFSPDSLIFPTQVVFTTSKAQTVTLLNTGLGILNIAKITATGQFVQTNTCGKVINPEATCTISVTFSPTTIGTLPGSVAVTDNAPESPQNVTLTGTGTYVQLTPNGLNFGNQPVGTTSLPKKITVSNKGSVSVTGSGVSITGSDPSDFAIQTNTCPRILAAGASCFVKVTFTPLAMGKRTAQVSFNDNGGGSPQNVALTGSGT